MKEELSMNQEFIKKLNDILEVNLENEQFGINELSVEIGVSRSQLHRKLQSIEGKSTSQFIRHYRLQKAMEMLQNDVATASEISYRVGFGSPTYFNTSFREFYGYPPGEVKFRKEAIQKESNSIQDSITVSKTTPNYKKLTKRNLTVIGTLLIVSLLTTTYYFYQNPKPKITSKTTETIVNDKSIAILPFKNLSNENENEYFIKGVMVSVQNQLGKFKDLKVISGQGMEKYADNSMAASEIAKEVGVSYLLEGSGQKIGDSIRIIIHLINAKDNKQLSSMVFDEEYKNIFGIQNSIAKQVAKDLNITLSPTEIEQIKKNPTENLEAYNFWLQANFQERKKTKNSFENALILYDKAIELDSLFIEAYIEKVNTWLLSGAIWGFSNEHEAWENAKQLLIKCNEIDSTHPEIHSALLAGLYLYEWDFKRMEKEYKNSDVDLLYEINTGRYLESLNECNQLIQNDPTNGYVYASVAQALYFLNRKDEALDLLKRSEELFSDNINFLREAAKYYYYMGEYESSKVCVKKLLPKISKYPPIVLWLNAIHENMNGNNNEVNKNLGDLRKKYEEEASGSPAWFLALYFSHIKDYENTILWLQKSYDRHEVEMIWLREEPLLIPIRNDSRYLDLYKKVGFPMKPLSSS